MNECLAMWQTRHAREHDHEGSEPPVVGASSGQDKSQGKGLRAQLGSLIGAWLVGMICSSF